MNVREDWDTLREAIRKQKGGGDQLGFLKTAKRSLNEYASESRTTNKEYYLETQRRPCKAAEESVLTCRRQKIFICATTMHPLIPPEKMTASLPLNGQASYSSDLRSCDYSMFLKPKITVKETRHLSREDIVTGATVWWLEHPLRRR